MKKAIPLAACLAAMAAGFSVSATAAPVEGMTCWAGRDNTVPKLMCGDPLKDVVSIKQLYERGWRVAATADISLGILFIVEAQGATK